MIRLKLSFRSNNRNALIIRWYLMSDPHSPAMFYFQGFRADGPASTWISRSGCKERWWYTDRIREGEEFK